MSHGYLNKYTAEEELADLKRNTQINQNEELQKYKRLAKKLAKLLMDLGAGDDVHNEADNCVKKHFPELYKRYL